MEAILVIETSLDQVTNKVEVADSMEVTEAEADLLVEVAEAIGQVLAGSRPYCHLCGKSGHVALDCHHRFDQNYPNPFTTQSQPASSFYITNNPSMQALLATPSTVFDPSRYPDLGASHHLTPDVTNLLNRLEYGGQGKSNWGTDQVTKETLLQETLKRWLVCLSFT